MFRNSVTLGDSDELLLPEGAELARMAARSVSEVGRNLYVVSSPRTCAKKTAQIFLEEAGQRGLEVVVDAVRPRSRELDR